MNFSKMHGLGNDFMVIDGVTQNVHLTAQTIKKLSDRHTGVGFEQLLLVEPPYSPDVDFHYRIFNADGSEVEQCGNGARCFAQFVRMKNLTKKNEIKVSTLKGIIILKVNKDQTITVNMGEPIFEPKKIPFIAQKEEKNYLIRTEETTVLCGVVSMGNPHCVIQVDELETTNIAIMGPLFEHHERFPERANIGFMQVLDRKTIKLRVHERGVGETSACGTGACGAVAVGIIHQKLDREVEVQLAGGTLKIEWAGKGHQLYMTGTATFVYDGFISI